MTIGVDFTEKFRIGYDWDTQMGAPYLRYQGKPLIFALNSNKGWHEQVKYINSLGTSDEKTWVPKRK